MNRIGDRVLDGGIGLRIGREVMPADHLCRGFHPDGQVVAFGGDRQFDAGQVFGEVVGGEQPCELQRSRHSARISLARQVIQPFPTASCHSVRA